MSLRVRYFVINAQTDIIHIQGYCEHTKPRKIPIRLFENIQELEAYAGRKLRLCRVCKKKLEAVKKM